MTHRGLAGQTRLVLIGAGGAGRSILGFVQASPCFLDSHNIGEIVFVDDVITSAEVPVVSTVADFEPEPRDVLLCTVTSNSAKRVITELLDARGATFVSFIHETAVIGPRVAIGPGAIIYPFCILMNDISIGAHAFLNTAVTIGHDVCVGDHVTVHGRSQLLGAVHVEEEVLFGAGAISMPGVRIGRRARIGAGSVVLHRVPADATVAGNPARKIS